MEFNPNVLPLIIDSQPNEVYHSHSDFISSSRLKAMGKSPLHFLKYESLEETEAIKLGTLTHTLVLEPDNYEKEYAVMKNVNLRTKEGKAYRDEFQVENFGKTVITQEMLDQSRFMRDSVMANEVMQHFMKGAIIEQSMYWQDELTGIKLRCRPDIRRRKVIIDLKTNDDSSPEGAAKSSAKFDYPLSGALYTEGVSVCMGHPVELYLFCFVEKNPPYAVGMYRLLESDLENARFRINNYLQMIKQCRETNIWPAYEGLPIAEKGIIDLQLPGWYNNRRN